MATVRRCDEAAPSDVRSSLGRSRRCSLPLHSGFIRFADGTPAVWALRRTVVK
jgi:hypothetical protein